MRERKTITVSELFGPPLSNKAPKGYHTTREIAEFQGCCMATAQRKVRTLDVDSVVINDHGNHTKAYRIELQ